MSQFSSKLCQKIRPYIAGEQPKDRKYVKLNTNENPYPASPNVKVMLNKFDIGKLKLYSDPNNTKLKEAISKHFKVATSNIFVGNGSDEILSFCIPAFSNKSVAFPNISYSFYPVFAEYYGKHANMIPLANDFTVTTSSFVNVKSDMIILANPNAPTGIAMDKNSIVKILETNPNKVVVIDEAYADFMGNSCIDLTEKYKNLLVVRTFSKSYSLAGARCGYAIGHYQLIEDLNKIKNSFNSYTVNSMTEVVAIAALEDDGYFVETTNAIINTRHSASIVLKEMDFLVLPSRSNFLFVQHKKLSAEYLYTALKEKGILVRYFNAPKIDNFLRITIGTNEEMTFLYRKLKEIFNEASNVGLAE